MKILDRYLVKQFLQIIIFGLIAFAVIFVVIDMMENLDSFIDQNAAYHVVFHYYLVFTPEILKLITPVAVLFAALFTAGKAANLSELTAMRASGVSMVRFMLPFLVTAFVISILSIAFSGYVVPMAVKTKVNLERTYLKRNISYAGSNLFFQDAKTRIVNISYFDNSSNEAIKVSIQEFATNDIIKMVSRIDGARMDYDSLSKAWVIKDGVKRTFTDTSEKADYFKEMKLTNLNFTPNELNSKQQKIEEMDLTELQEQIAIQKRAGSDPTDAEIEYHSRFSFSMASFIIVFFGLPISANRRKGGLAVQVGINILVTFIYLVFMKISQAFGSNGSMNPILTAWLANLIFIGAALYNLPKMKE